MKAKHSKKDDKGHVYVDCSECDRGGNIETPPYADRENDMSNSERRIK